MPAQGSAASAHHHPHHHLLPVSAHAFYARASSIVAPLRRTQTHARPRNSVSPSACLGFPDKNVLEITQGFICEF